jgi:hypothetical protein
MEELTAASVAAAAVAAIGEKVAVGACSPGRAGCCCAKGGEVYPNCQPPDGTMTVQM